MLRVLPILMLAGVSLAAQAQSGAERAVDIQERSQRDAKRSQEQIDRLDAQTREMLECDLSLELDAIPDLKEAIKYCESVSDYVSRDLFREILDAEEEHVDWLETQLDLIAKMGLENYHQAQIVKEAE